MYVLVTYTYVCTYFDHIARLVTNINHRQTKQNVYPHNTLQLHITIEVNITAR